MSKKQNKTGLAKYADRFNGQTIGRIPKWLQTTVIMIFAAVLGIGIIWYVLMLIAFQGYQF